MSNLQLFIDIECIPSDIMPELASIKAPANYKDPDKILAWQKDNQLELYKKQALDSMEGRIICIGWYDDDCFQYCCSNEHINILALEDAIIKMQGQYIEPITFIGWNISTFDIPWLWRKAIQYNLPKLRNALPHNNKNMVIDLMKIWAADYRDYVSLADCAKFLGIPHEGGDGSEIYDLWKANNLEAIAEHCKRDITTCMEIYRRIYT
jgi:3'-5' exonuclease